MLRNCDGMVLRHHRQQEEYRCCQMRFVNSIKEIDGVNLPIDGHCCIVMPALLCMQQHLVIFGNSDLAWRPGKLNSSAMAGNFVLLVCLLQKQGVCGSRTSCIVSDFSLLLGRLQYLVTAQIRSYLVSRL
jgi:hypothetical protein